ncbi:hypothetical protein [Planktothricoides raciborskii]|uniref:Uncharacterized protein n=1 Tax=Planktothricoides raciborskii FACHB-1370 TaxID=2949576 RepID=A0ABR8EJW8_9CYAN|nr:hypothetical protein [Planktothricoides raciborskii]MBD2546612.1 hypothetical protein [Planktothricoides raciborskii FACHB-1370]MBD2585132.1 hypothetical protein [Planktothricoides raciborskii FACHB-1261]
MKGYIQGQTIILIEPLPENLREGDEVDVSIAIKPQKTYPFPTFQLGVKDEYLNREKIYKKNLLLDRKELIQATYFNQNFEQ